MKDLQKGFGLSLLIHCLIFMVLGYYTAKRIQAPASPATVKVSFVSIPEELVQQKPVLEEVTPPEPVKSVDLEKKLPEKKVEKKREIKKVERPKPIEKRDLVKREQQPIPQPMQTDKVAPPVQQVSNPSPAEVYISLNLAGISKSIQENLVYPRMARKMGWTGKVFVTFLITRTGEARDIEITRTSGRSLLDNAVIEALQRISTFPIPETPTSITVPVSFSLEQ